MAKPKTVWGIDIGQCALKALKLSSVDGEIHLEAFDVIEHPKILSQPGVDPEQLMRNALEQFLARNNVLGSKVVVSAPGKSGITRFVKLPPVEPKRVPEIVRFEAEQQIPFDINEVIWRWQPFRDPDSPDIEVGIFAMKRPDVAGVLDRFTEVGLTVDTVQMAPLALYNFLVFDGQSGGDGATLLVDIGADSTDLVVADGAKIWTRTMQRGGNNFTEALVKGFKLSFRKAEKFKRTAATSKYARQIFQAMRPVFAEVVQEIQRSIGYYTSLHRDSRFQRVIGLGNGFRLPGLQKFLEQNLNVPVARVDSFNKLSPSAAVNAPAFTENVLSFAVCYGLALQGLGLTRISTNLLPSEIARRRLWAKKRPWFAASAAALLIAFAGYTWRAYADQNRLNPEGNAELSRVASVLRKADADLKDFGTVRGRDSQAKALAEQFPGMLAHNDFWEKMHGVVSTAIGNVATDQAKMKVKKLAELKKIPRPRRRVIVLTGLYKKDVENVDGMDAESIKAYYSGRGTGLGSGGGMPPRSAMPGGPNYSMGAPRRLTGYAMAPRPAVAGGPPRPMGGGEKRPASVQTGPARRGFVLFLAGTTPQRGISATNFLTELKNELTGIVKQAQAAAGSGSDPLASLPVDDVIADKIVQITAGREPETPGETHGTASLHQSQTRGVVDPLTGELAGGDTEFVVGWLFRLKEDKPLKPIQAKAGQVEPGVQQRDLRVRGMQ